MSGAAQSNKRGRGRPPAFDRREALRRAMRLFWDRGYEGTTFDELTTAMGISPSSFHNSFGSKQRLYAEATDFYLNETARWFADTLSGQADARAAFQALVEATAEQFTCGGRPAGCMICLAGTHVAPACDAIREMMMTHRALGEQTLKARLDEGIASGDLPGDTNAAALAAFFSAVFRGMAVQARDGATRERLLEVGRLAMRAWPDAPAALSQSAAGSADRPMPDCVRKRRGTPAGKSRSAAAPRSA